MSPRGDALEGKLDAYFDRFDKAMSRLDDKLDRMDVTLAKQQTILEEHIRRTEILEASMGPLREGHLQTKFFMKIAAGVMAAGASGFGLKELLAVLGGGM